MVHEFGCKKNVTTNSSKYPTREKRKLTVNVLEEWRKINEKRVEGRGSVKSRSFISTVKFYRVAGLSFPAEATIFFLKFSFFFLLFYQMLLRFCVCVLDFRSLSLYWPEGKSWCLVPLPLSLFLSAWWSQEREIERENGVVGARHCSGDISATGVVC